VVVGSDAFPETTEAIVERTFIECLSDATIYLASEIIKFLFVATSWACFSAFQRRQSFEKVQWAAWQFEHFIGFSQSVRVASFSTAHAHSLLIAHLFSMAEPLALETSQRVRNICGDWNRDIPNLKVFFWYFGSTETQNKSTGICFIAVLGDVITSSDTLVCQLFHRQNKVLTRYIEQHP